jgi:hypothetical protein
MSGFYPETNVNPLYPVVDTNFLPAVPQRVTTKQLVPLISYTHNQSAASAQWVVTHTLGFKPNVTVFDSAGDVVEGHIIHNSVNQLTLQFSSPMSGVAQLS